METSNQHGVRDARRHQDWRHFASQHRDQRALPRLSTDLNYPLDDIIWESEHIFTVIGRTNGLLQVQSHGYDDPQSECVFAQKSQLIVSENDEPVYLLRLMIDDVIEYGWIVADCFEQPLFSKDVSDLLGVKSHSNLPMGIVLVKDPQSQLIKHTIVAGNTTSIVPMRRTLQTA